MTNLVDSIGRIIRGSCPRCNKPARTGRHCSKACGQATRNRSEKVKTWFSEYSKTESRREKMRRYRAIYLRSEKGKLASHRQYLRVARLYPEKIKARSAISHAVAEGKLLRPKSCASCGREGKVEAHHYAGYSRENWLAIRWLCCSCHFAAESCK
jgi:hypothetical protein